VAQERLKKDSPAESGARAYGRFFARGRVVAPKRGLPQKPPARTATLVGVSFDIRGAFGLNSRAQKNQLSPGPAAGAFHLPLADSAPASVLSSRYESGAVPGYEFGHGGYDGAADSINRVRWFGHDPPSSAAECAQCCRFTHGVDRRRFSAQAKEVTEQRARDAGVNSKGATRSPRYWLSSCEAAMTSRIRAPCADCQIDTLRRGADWYMVHNHVWECAWPGAKTTFPVREQSNDEVVPFSQILCIDCLKRRLGRDLMY
jgi:hypothetical protein